MHWKVEINPKKSAEILQEEEFLMNVIRLSEVAGQDPIESYRNTFRVYNPYQISQYDKWAKEEEHLKTLVQHRDEWDDITCLSIQRNLIVHRYVAMVGPYYDKYVHFLKRWKCDKSIVSKEKFDECYAEYERVKNIDLSIRHQGTTSMVYRKR